MDGKQLTDRLIEDIERSIEIRNSVPDVLTQIKQTNLELNDLSDFVGALNTIGFDGHLRIVVDLININNTLIEFNKDDIPNALAQIIENKDAIVKGFQELLDNEDLVTIDGANNVEPIKTTLIEKLDDLHGYSGKFLS